MLGVVGGRHWRGGNKVATLNPLFEYTNFAFYNIKIQHKTTEIAKRGKEH